MSLATTVTELHLAAFDSWIPLPALPAPGTYRVRCSASGLDAAHQADPRLPGDPVVDRYLLQLWPAPQAPEAVMREGSEIAAYWHRVARGEGA